ncbi:hypothetical protein RND81_05G176800 [Saponaria officinalis]|uniref:Disease resistance protein RGA3 n=3 Tax=Saponaria officinalis TaxID=3572 RepID=A0AAW1KZJ2_SAPOF
MAESLLIEVGKNLAVDAAKALVQSVIGRASEEIRLAWGFRDELEKLRRKFEYVEALLEDLGRSKQAQQSKLVDAWLNRFKNVAYMADNVMDEYAYEMLRRKQQLRLKKSDGFSIKFRNCFTLSSNTTFFRIRMSLKVRQMLSLFDELDVEAKAIGLSQVEVARDAVRGTAFINTDDRSRNQAREHASGVDNTNGFVGRKDDERKLIENLCVSFNEVDQLPMAAIVGIGGLGKTALARRLYDHHEINTHFGDNKVWICVSENFNITRLLNEMVEALTSNKGDLSNKDGILRKLEEKLKGKKFFLVLDDVWNEDQELWDSLRESLHKVGGLPGSVILITTRNKEVPNAARAVYIHGLEGLTPDESWDLFKHKVFLNDVSDLEEIGRRIVNKCKGVPLAINVIGCLLKSKQHSRREWEAIETSELWELPQGRNQILPSLLLSFNHLPSPSLKQCFAFCAIFPKDRVIEKDILIALWLAQGFLHIPSSETRKLTEEDIGDEICGVLLNNLFLQEDEIKKGGTLRYKMHDLVHDLAVYVSRDLLLIRDVKGQRKDGDYRHLVFTSEKDEQELLSESPEAKTFRKLRTISFEGVNSRSWWIHALYLRTLVLRSTELSEVPSAIELLKHLRFLDLSYNPIRMLPDSICKLYHLETLGLLDCKWLPKLPAKLDRLVNLRHIMTTTPMYASKGLAELKNLQTLPHLALDDGVQGWTIDELGCLHELRGEICIHRLEHVQNREQADKAALNRNDKVIKLTLTWAQNREETSQGNSDEDVLDGLQPHAGITWLELKNFYGKTFPSWLMNMTVVTSKLIGGNPKALTNLTMLKLLNCKNCRTLPTLGHLPFLKTLRLSMFDVETIGIEFYASSNPGNGSVKAFQSLRKLVISSFPRLTTWIVPSQEDASVCPCLVRLQVQDCPELKSIPALDCESLTHLELHKLSSLEFLDILKVCTGLTMLHMCGMSLLTCLPAELANYRNLQRLDIETFEKLVSLPSLQSLRSLQALRINSHALTILPDDLFHGLSSLQELTIYNCEDLERIPTSLIQCTSLKKLWIFYCEMDNAIPADLSMFRRLSDLVFSSYSVTSLRSMLEALEQLPLLRVLGIEGFRDEQQLGEYFSDMTPFLRLHSLKELRLLGWSEIRSLPEQLGLLTRITSLYIWFFEDCSFLLGLLWVNLMVIM